MGWLLGLNEPVIFFEIRMLSRVTVDASVREWGIAHVFIVIIIQRLGVSIVSLATVLCSISNTHPSMPFTFFIS